MRSTRRALAVLFLAAPAAAQTWIYDQPLAPGGGTMRSSQLWIDPTGQNDSDNDAIAWEDFELAQDAVITSVRWIGDPAPSLGFQISILHQDPGTVAVQPDIVAAGSAPIVEEIHTAFAQTEVAPGLFQFEVDLATPVFCAANTRYFVSVVGRMPLSYTSWRWAASSTGPNGTFWWQRGLHMYFHLPESRATSLGTSWGAVLGAPLCIGDGSSGPCPCGNTGSAGLGCENSTGEGSALVALGSESVSADDLVVATLGLPANASCLTFASASLVAGVPFGDGRRCLVGTVSRFELRNSGASGSVSYGPGLSAFAATHFPSANQFTAGRTLAFQTWYRDTSGPCGNLTNVSSARGISFLP